MKNLQEMTLSLVAAKNARDDAEAHWNEVMHCGGQTNVDAQQAMTVARMNYEHSIRVFRELLVELKQENLLELSIDSLDGESHTWFRRMIAQLGLDEYTAPIAYTSFDHLAVSWRSARRFLTAARELESHLREFGSAGLAAAMQQVIELEPEQRHADVLKGWQHLLALLQQQCAGTTSDDTEASDEAGRKLVRYARASVDNVTAMLAGKIARLRPEELRAAMAKLDADLGLELKRAMVSGLVPCPQRLLAEPQSEPEPQRQSRTAVATLVRESEEVAEDADLSAEQEAMVDELLRDLAHGDGN